VSKFVVRRLLRELGYSLQANAKTAEGGQHRVGVQPHVPVGVRADV